MQMSTFRNLIRSFLIEASGWWEEEDISLVPEEFSVGDVIQVKGTSNESGNHAIYTFDVEKHFPENSATWEWWVLGPPSKKFNLFKPAQEHLTDRDPGPYYLFSRDRQGAIMNDAVITVIKKRVTESRERILESNTVSFTGDPKLDEVVIDHVAQVLDEILAGIEESSDNRISYMSLQDRVSDLVGKIVDRKMFTSGYRFGLTMIMNDILRSINIQTGRVTMEPHDDLFDVIYRTEDEGPECMIYPGPHFNDLDLMRRTAPLIAAKIWKKYVKMDDRP